VLWRTIRTSAKLRRLSPSLAAMPTGGSQRELIACSEVRDAAMTQLLDLCESIPAVREVMHRHGANRQTLRRLFDFLVESGSDGSAKGHYAAASVLCTAQTLDFAFRTLDAFQAEKNQLGVLYPLPETFDVASPPE
jgi:hypothetical protein